MPSRSSNSPASSQIPPQLVQWSISTSASSRVIIAFLQTGQSTKLSVEVATDFAYLLPRLTTRDAEARWNPLIYRLRSYSKKSKKIKNFYRMPCDKIKKIVTKYYIIRAKRSRKPMIICQLLLTIYYGTFVSHRFLYQK